MAYNAQKDLMIFEWMSKYRKNSDFRRVFCTYVVWQMHALCIGKYVLMDRASTIAKKCCIYASFRVNVSWKPKEKERAERYIKNQQK